MAGAADDGTTAASEAAGAALPAASSGCTAVAASVLEATVSSPSSVSTTRERLLTGSSLSGALSSARLMSAFVDVATSSSMVVMKARGPLRQGECCSHGRMQVLGVG